jgi:hypothetical protein
MRTFRTLSGVLAVCCALAGHRGGVSVSAAQGLPDAERFLAERFAFTPAEIARARGGEPVGKLLNTGERDQLAIGGAVRLDGDKARLADWIKNIAHFRGSAELGMARVIDSPPTPRAFADLALDAADLAAIAACNATECALRLSSPSIAEFNSKVSWGTPQANGQANALMRTMLAGYAAAYLERGDAAIGNGFGELLQGATSFNEMVPQLADYLRRFPAATLAGVEQRLYWSAMPTEKGSILALHQLALYRPAAGAIVIADKTIYASRYFDSGALVISLQDAADGRGYYLIAGSRVKSSALTGAAASVLKRQIQRSAVDTIQMYLVWLRDSLR